MSADKDKLQKIEQIKSAITLIRSMNINQASIADLEDELEKLTVNKENKVTGIKTESGKFYSISKDNKIIHKEESNNLLGMITNKRGNVDYIETSVLYVAASSAEKILSEHKNGNKIRLGYKDIDGLHTVTDTKEIPHELQDKAFVIIFKGDSNEPKAISPAKLEPTIGSVAINKWYNEKENASYLKIGDMEKIDPIVEIVRDTPELNVSNSVKQKSFNRKDRDLEIG